MGEILKQRILTRRTEGAPEKTRQVVKLNDGGVAELLRMSVMHRKMERMRVRAMPVRRLLTCYQCAIMEVETKFRVLNEEFSLHSDRNPIESIKTRLKTIESIAEKLTRRGLPLTTESIANELNDVAGVRVICSFPEDVYSLADSLLQQDDITLVERKDYIAHPKPNGYRSLHLIVEVPIFLAEEKRPMRVEIQLRTIAMDFWASLEHQMKYKKDVPAKEADRITEELRLCAEQSAALDRRMEEIRQEIQSL